MMFVCFLFEAESLVIHAGLEFAMQLRMTLNFWLDYRWALPTSPGLSGAGYQLFVDGRQVFSHQSYISSLKK